MDYGINVMKLVKKVQKEVIEDIIIANNVQKVITLFIIDLVIVQMKNLMIVIMI